MYVLGPPLFLTFIQRVSWGCRNKHLPENTECFCEMGTHKLVGWAPARGLSFAGYLVLGVTAPWDYLWEGGLFHSCTQNKNLSHQCNYGLFSLHVLNSICTFHLFFLRRTLLRCEHVMRITFSIVSGKLRFHTFHPISYFSLWQATFSTLLSYLHLLRLHHTPTLLDHLILELVHIALQCWREPSIPWVLVTHVSLHCDLGLSQGADSACPLTQAVN